MKKNNKILVIIAIALTLIITASVFVKTIKPKKKEQNYETSKLTFDCIDYKNVCTRNYNGIDITLQPVTDKDDYTTYTVKINEKTVLTDITSISDDFDILDNIIIFTTGGTDIRSTTLYAFDKEGNKLLDVYSLDKAYPTMLITPLYTYDSLEPDINYEIENNKIKLKGTRYSHGLTIILSEDSECRICENDNITKCAEEVVMGDYEIEYLGNKQFSDIKNTNYLKLKDDKEIGQYCEEE